MFNDLIEELEGKGMKVFAYADDLAVSGVAEEELEKAIKICLDWAKKNNMQINTAKSGVLIHNRNKIEQKIR